MSSSTLTLKPSGWDVVAGQTTEAIRQIALSAALHGCFTTLVLIAFTALLVKQWHTHRFTTIVLGLALVLLYASTTLAVIITILETQGSILWNAMHMVQIIWEGTFLLEVTPSVLNSLTSGPISYGSCANTAALTVNILLGDSIVCWRALLLWPGNRVIKGISIILLLTTFALGAVDIRFRCLFGELTFGESLNGNTGVPGGMYGGSPYGIAASVLSLSVNLFATITVSYKAWKSKRFLRKFMVSGNRTTQVERLFSVFVESGMVYCTIWIFVVAWQIFVHPIVDGIAPAFQFQVRFGEFIDGGLIPITAIYPVVVIILIAQNNSHIETAFGGGAANTLDPSRLDGIRVSSATVLHIARMNQVGGGSKESSTHTTEEWKMESGSIA